MSEKVIELLAWPAAVVIIAIVAMLIFRGPAASLIGRIKKIGAGERGIDFSDGATEKQQIEAQSKMLLPAAPIENHPLGPPSPSIAEMEKRVIERLASFNETQDLTMKRLIRGFAVTNQQKDFEILHRLIFGSQLDLLLAANAGGVSQDHARLIFENAKTNHPHAHEAGSFEAWMEFPENTGIITTHEDGRIMTTDRGKEFMQYLVQVGLTSPKSNG